MQINKNDIDWIFQGEPQDQEVFNRPVKQLIDLLGDAQDSNVVQTTGNSTSDIMSQKAVTDALNTKQATLATNAIGTISKNSSTANYLRGDGTWATPPNTTYTASTGLNLSGTAFSVKYGTAAGTALQGNSLVQATGTSTTSIMSQKAVTDAINSSTGGQAWRNMTSSRSLGTTYTNTTGRPIIVSVFFGGSSYCRIDVDGVQVVGSMNPSSSSGMSLTVVIPAGSVYRQSTNRNQSFELVRWVEMR